MSNSIFWINDVFRKSLAGGLHDMDTDTYRMALITSALATEETAYSAVLMAVGDVVVPTVRNGHRYIVTYPGTPSAEPTWPTTVGGEVTATGGVTYEEYGGDLCSYEDIADVVTAEVATGAGYTTNGAEIITKTLTMDYRITNWDAADLTWTSLTKTFRYGFIYNTGEATGGIVGYMLFDEDFLDITVTGVDFEVRWAGTGIIGLCGEGDV